ncbi:MAG: hypothetical protein MI747_20265 [Desulfobacterales bacterium]|nr:hypothetical protein [Desulfobacterales bacterium]
MTLEENKPLDPQLTAAVDKMSDFVAQITGQAPTAEELARAMTKYFVLKELVEYIQMEREEAEE